MKNRYVKNQPLELIHIRPTVDPALWKHLVTKREEIQEVLECDANNRLVWKIGNPSTNLGSIVQSISV